MHHVQRNVENARGVERRIGALGGAVTLADLFPAEWIDDHTEFDDVRALVAESEFQVAGQSDFDAIPDRDWDSFVAAHTEFSDWEEMLGRALERYAD